MTYRFGIFDFDSESGELRKNGRAVALEPQPAKALALLLARGGHVVSRDELRDAVWGRDTHVDFDRGLAYCMSQVRSALGDSGDNPRFVQTIPKRGYKFIVPVAAPAGASPVSTESSERRAVPASYVFPAAASLLIVLAAAGWWLVMRARAENPGPVVVAVSIFDNETGIEEHDRLVAGLSDLVVTKLTSLAPERIAVVGNAAVLRQPRNIRNLDAVAKSLRADYVLLGQLQRSDTGVRFITHFIRLRDQAHLKANRLQMPDGGVSGLEAAVVDEFERAVREHVLTRGPN